MDKQILQFEGDLVLDELSTPRFPVIKHYQHTKTIDLQGLKNIDSAGIAYLVQIKTVYPPIQFINCAEKVSILSALYGVDFLFK